jgi:hypothetical protein
LVLEVDLNPISGKSNTGQHKQGNSQEANYSSIHIESLIAGIPNVELPGIIDPYKNGQKTSDQESLGATGAESAVVELCLHLPG